MFNRVLGTLYMRGAAVGHKLCLSTSLPLSVHLLISGSQKGKCCLKTPGVYLCQVLNACPILCVPLTPHLFLFNPIWGKQPATRYGHKKHVKHYLNDYFMIKYYVVQSACCSCLGGRSQSTVFDATYLSGHEYLHRKASKSHASANSTGFFHFKGTVSSLFILSFPI